MTPILFGQIILESNDGSRDDVLNPNDSSNDDNQIEDPNNQSNLDNAPVIPEIIEETPAQDNLALDNQNPELEEKVVKFASLQDLEEKQTLQLFPLVQGFGYLKLGCLEQAFPQ